MKRAKYLVMSVPATLGTSALVLAEETGTANAAVVSAMTSVSQDMIATANAIIPVALTVVGIGLVVVFGVKMFRRIAK